VPFAAESEARGRQPPAAHVDLASERLTAFSLFPILLRNVCIAQART
jgi:hypothetical protein